MIANANFFIPACSRYLPRVTSFRADAFVGIQASYLFDVSFRSLPIRSLPKEIFSHFRNLKKVSLVNTKLTSLPPGLFKNNHGLVELNLYTNDDLACLPPNLFPKPPQDCGRVAMKILRVKNNPKFEGFPPGFFKCMRNLNELDAGGSAGKIIGKKIFTATHAPALIQIVGATSATPDSSQPVISSTNFKYGKILYDGTIGYDYGWTLYCRDGPGGDKMGVKKIEIQAEYCRCNPFHEPKRAEELPLTFTTRNLYASGYIDNTLGVRLNECEGTCSTDAHCADGLRCFPGNNWAPGCKGDPKTGATAKSKKYCYKPKLRVVDDGASISCVLDGNPPPFSCVLGHASYELCKPLPSVCPSKEGVDITSVCGTQGVAVNANFRDFFDKPVRNIASTFKHTADGKFTGWSAGNVYDSGKTGQHEWDGIKAVRGAFANMYFDYDGDKLHVLADWVYKDNKALAPGCFALFDVWSSGGRNHWTFKVYADRVAGVVHNGKDLNSTLVAASGEVASRAGFGLSPLAKTKAHAIFEVSFDTDRGDVGLQISAPGPRYICEILEEDKAKYLGRTFGGSRSRSRRAEAPTGAEVRSVEELVFDTAADSLIPANGFCTMGQGNSPDGCEELPPIEPNATINNDWDAVEFVSLGNGFCRGDAGSTHDMYSVSGKTEGECERVCAQDIRCSGYEYRASPSQTCGIVAPGGLKTNEQPIGWDLYACDGKPGGCGKGITSTSGTAGVVCKEKQYKYLDKLIRFQKSTAKHKCDGKFTRWSVKKDYPKYDFKSKSKPRPKAAYEWHDIKPARGRFTNAYFDFDGEYLYVLNDWIYNDNPQRPVYPECFNLFEIWTAGGAERWEIKVYGDQTTEVTRNGEPAGDNCGATGNGQRSPLEKKKGHSIFELSFKVMPGGFGMQLADPGPRFACNVVETEVVKFIGTLDPGGGGGVTPTLTPWPRLQQRLVPPNFCTLPAEEIPPHINCTSGGDDKSVVEEVFENYEYGDVPHLCDGAFTDLVTNKPWDGKGLLPPNPLLGLNHGNLMAFPNWNGTHGVKHEWLDTGAISADLMHVYMDIDRDPVEDAMGGEGRSTMHVMVDWRPPGGIKLRPGFPLGPDCYNYFVVRTSDEEVKDHPFEYWKFWLYGDNTARVEFNGDVILDRGDNMTSTELISCASSGFGYSLKYPTAEHQTSEFSFRTRLGPEYKENYLIYFDKSSDKYTCDVMQASGAGVGKNRTGVIRTPRRKPKARFTGGCPAIEDVLVVDVSELLDENGAGCIEDPMDAAPGNDTWFHPLLTESSVEDMVHGPFGRRDGCLSTNFVGFVPGQTFVALSVRFMSFDMWERQGLKEDEVYLEVNGQLIESNSRRKFCENGWIKYAAEGVKGGIDLGQGKSRDNCYYDMLHYVNASEDGGWINVTIRHNLEDAIDDESMAFNQFAFGCYTPSGEPFFDLNFDRCVNYTNGTLNEGAPNPFYGVIEGDEASAEPGGSTSGGRRARQAAAVTGSAVGLELVCEDEWTMIQGTCYKIFPESEMSFGAVLDTTPGGMFGFCSSVKDPSGSDESDLLGASFAEIRSAEVNAAIRDMAEDYYNPYFALQIYNRLQPNPLGLQAAGVPTELAKLEYGWNAGPKYIPHATAMGGPKTGDNEKLELVDWTNWAAGYPSGKDGASWSGKQCVYMNRDGEWQDVSCKATLEAEGVLCSAAPRLKTTAATSTTTVTTTTVLDLHPCDPREFESGAEKEDGGGKAGQSKWVSPNGWEVTSGTPTYSNKEYYWLSNLLDKSDSCRAPWKCAGDREGDEGGNIHHCYWMAATGDKTWLNIKLPGETYVDYVELDLRTRPGFEVESFKVRSNRGDHTPFNLTGKVHDYLFDQEWRNEDPVQALRCGPLFRVNISRWITDVRISDIVDKKELFVAFGEIRIYGHNPCECEDYKKSTSSTSTPTTPIITTTPPKVEEQKDGPTTTPLDNAEKESDITIIIAVVVAISTCCCFVVALLFWLRGRKIVLTFEGAKKEDLTPEDVAALEEQAIRLVVEHSFKLEKGKDVALKQDDDREDIKGAATLDGKGGQEAGAEKDAEKDRAQVTIEVYIKRAVDSEDFKQTVRNLVAASAASAAAVAEATVTVGARSMPLLVVSSRPAVDDQENNAANEKKAAAITVFDNPAYAAAPTGSAGGEGGGYLQVEAKEDGSAGKAEDDEAFGFGDAESVGVNVTGNIAITFSLDDNDANAAGLSF